MSKTQGLKESFAGQATRLTAPREAIIEFLSKSKEHMSAKEIYVSLHSAHPGIGLSTVYRTLDMLAEMGMVTKISIGDRQSRYEFRSTDKDDHHHHLICTQCGKIIDYSEFMAEELRLVKMTGKKLAKKFNFVIQDHNIEYIGICEDCE